MSGCGSVEDVIPDAKAPTEALSIAEVAETVEYEPVLPIFVLGSGHSDRVDVFVYLIHETSETVFHDQSHNPS